MFSTHGIPLAVWAPLAGVVFLAAIAAYSWRRRDVPGALPLAIGALFGIGILLSSACEAAAAAPAVRLVWRNIGAALILPAVTAVTCFALDYASPGRWLTRRNLALLWLPAALMALLIFAGNDRLMWARVEVAADGAAAAQPTAIVKLAIAYGIALALVNAIAFAWLFVRSPQHRWPAALMLLAQLVARGLFVLDVARDTAPFALDAIVSVVLVTFGTYAIALFGFRILDPLPAAREAVLEQIRSGVVVFDNAGRALDLNPAAETILGIRAAAARGKTWPQLAPAQADALAAYGVPCATEDLPNIVLGNGASAREYAPAVTWLRDGRGLSVGAVLMLRDVTEQKAAEAQRVEQQHALATLRERERLARELHDSTGQILAYVSAQAQAIEKRVHDGDATAAEAQLRRLAQAAQESHTDVREAILSLRAGQAGARSFPAALKQYLAAYREQFGINARLTIDPCVDDATVAPSCAVQLLRVVQEALTNARKHSGAACVSVLVGREGDEVVIAIEDDGVGFALGAEPNSVDARGGYGLGFMRERMAEIGGNLAIDSAPGAGTRVVLRAPCAGGARGRPAEANTHQEVAV
jgi:signal transduction histidine kinase